MRDVTNKVRNYTPARPCPVAVILEGILVLGFFFIVVGLVMGG